MGKLKNFIDFSYERKKSLENINEIVNTVAIVDIEQDYKVYQDHVKRDYLKIKHRRRKLKHKISEYVNSFTVHGLTRIVTGNKFEKVIWSLIVTTAIVAAGYILHGFVMKYFKHETYLDVHAKIDEKAYHPAITFCLSRYTDMYKSFYCGYPMFLHPDMHDRCKNETFDSFLPYIDRQDSLWSNGIFHITKCFANTNCPSDLHFKSITNVHGACITWNYNKTMYQIYNKAQIEFEIEKKVFENFYVEPYISVTVHHYNLDSEFLIPQLQLIPNQVYYLQVDKKVIKRLPHPFPSNCTSKRPSDSFPGDYHRRVCIIMDYDTSIYKRCGGIRDITNAYISKDIKTNYKRENETIFEAIRCFNEDSIDDFQASCPIACEEVSYPVKSFVMPVENKDTDFHTYSVEIGYQTIDMYEIQEEKEVYPWDKMLSEFGGFLGLVIGASVISLFEILIYFVLCILKKLS